MILLDTCALIWWTIDPAQLSPTAATECKRMEQEGGGFVPWDHPDPADRTIVATARLRGLPLLTPDRLITSFYPQTLW
jgi:PIN domain nuclease of toxin-antitoxin system